MAAVGEPRENGHAERLMRTIKAEAVELSEYRDYDDAYAQLGAFLDAVYNVERIHSALGYLTPSEFEARGAGNVPLQHDPSFPAAWPSEGLRPGGGGGRITAVTVRVTHKNRPFVVSFWGRTSCRQMFPSRTPQSRPHDVPAADEDQCSLPSLIDGRSCTCSHRRKRLATTGHLKLASARRRREGTIHPKRMPG